MPFGNIISQRILERGMNPGTEYTVSDLESKGFKYMGKFILAGCQEPEEVERYDKGDYEILLGQKEEDLVRIVRFIDLKHGFQTG